MEGKQACPVGRRGAAFYLETDYLPLTSARWYREWDMFLSSLMELTTSSILWSAGSETVGVVIFNFTSAGKTNGFAYSTDPAFDPLLVSVY